MWRYVLSPEQMGQLHREKLPAPVQTGQPGVTSSRLGGDGAHGAPQCTEAASSQRPGTWSGEEWEGPGGWREPPGS